MYKEEFILIHQLLIYLTKFLNDAGASDSYFEGYRDLKISPHHIHRTKGEHKYAVFLLAHGISRALTDGDVVPEGLSRKMEEIASRTKKECYWLQD